MNKWKIAFWSLLIVFIITTACLVYAIIDQAVTLTYMKEGYEDTEYDLQQISNFIKGKLSKEDFKEYFARHPDGTSDSSTVDLKRIRITFDQNDKVDSVTTIW